MKLKNQKTQVQCTTQQWRVSSSSHSHITAAITDLKATGVAEILALMESALTYMWLDFPSLALIQSACKMLPFYLCAACIVVNHYTRPRKSDFISCTLILSSLSCLNCCRKDPTQVGAGKHEDAFVTAKAAVEFCRAASKFSRVIC